MREKKKLVKNISEKIQIVTHRGKEISIMPGEVVAAELVTNGKGVLFDGFEFFSEVSVYTPKPLDRRVNRGEAKVPFEGMKERVKKGMGEVKKAVKKTTKKKAIKKTAKKVSKKKAVKK
jgi:hypothetical protein